MTKPWVQLSLSRGFLKRFSHGFLLISFQHRVSEDTRNNWNLSSFVVDVRFKTIKRNFAPISSSSSAVGAPIFKDWAARRTGANWRQLVSTGINQYILPPPGGFHPFLFPSRKTFNRPILQSTRVVQPLSSDILFGILVGILNGILCDMLQKFCLNFYAYAITFYPLDWTVIGRILRDYFDVIISIRFLDRIRFRIVHIAVSAPPQYVHIILWLANYLAVNIVKSSELPLIFLSSSLGISADQGGGSTRDTNLHIYWETTQFDSMLHNPRKFIRIHLHLVIIANLHVVAAELDERLQIPWNASPQKILQDSHRFSKILKDSPRFSKILERRETDRNLHKMPIRGSPNAQETSFFKNRQGFFQRIYDYCCKFPFYGN